MKLALKPVFCVALFFAVFGFPAGHWLAWADEAVSLEEPTPTSVEDSVSPIGRSFREREPPPLLFPGLKDRLKDTDPFFRDTNLSVNLRTYYFYRDKYDDSVSEAWAIGGSFSYRSGWFLNHFGAGAVFYLSEPLYAPEDRDGTQLLKPGQEGYAVLGQLYGRVKLFEDHFLNLYRYEYNTPYINKYDSYIEEMKKTTARQGELIRRPFGECFIQHVGSGHPADNILKEILGDLCVTLARD